MRMPVGITFKGVRGYILCKNVKFKIIYDVSCDPIASKLTKKIRPL